MLRLIGILTGAVLAIAILIVALGVPELSPPPDDIEVADILVPAEEPEPLAYAPPEPAPAVTAAADEPAAAPADPPEQAVAVTEPQPEPQPKPEPQAAPAPEFVTTNNWYAFWSPFRSEIAASGFVARLQETTGIDYRVVKVRTGVYEVAFAYADDADIEEKLARIANATGLDMSGG